jgi:uncharacterized membrane protein YdbT with pleckstrin-like domain
MPDETVVLRGRVHWIILMPSITLFIIASVLYFYFNQLILGFVLTCFAFVASFRGLVYFFTTELAVTDHRVLAKFGLIKRATYELNLDRITGLNVDQSVLGRLLNYGNVIVRGMGGDMTPIPAIRDPIGFRHEVLGEVERREGEI